MYQKQSQQQHNQSPSPCFIKVIGKPKQLIQKASINKVYSQQWGNSIHLTPLSGSIILNQRQQLTQTKKCSTQMQFRNVTKNGIKTKKGKYGIGGNRACLRDIEEAGQLGTLIYERVRQKANWNWTVNRDQKAKILQPEPSPDFRESSIEFDSKFESGNLLRAYKSQQSSIKTYVLLTQNDTNTFGYNQWFYFRVRSKNSFESVRFQIINMRKKYSSFEKGMKIATLSEQKWKQQKIGWHRAGSNIEYFPNDIKLNENSDESYYTLGWDWGFERENQWIYFAYSYPYTYSQLKLMVDKTKKYQGQAEWTRLCFSSLKNQIYLLRVDVTNLYRQKPKREKSNQDTIDMNFVEKEDEIERMTKQKIKFNRLLNKKRESSFNQHRGVQTIQHSMLSSQMQKNRKKSPIKPQKVTKLNLQKDTEKEILVIMGRCHPGETPSSFIMEGVIDSLLKQNSNQIKYLKQKLAIYVIPMLNPDGVIHGNTRTSLSGNDLNRRWTKPHYLLHPEVYKVKQYFKDLKQKGKNIFAMIDLHGHTKKQNCFLYGCCDRKNYHHHAEVKLLNRLLSNADSNFNSIYSSHFVGESKKSTARVSFYREFKCFSYTIQASFLGCCNGSFHFSTLDYYNLGQNLLKSLAYFHAATRGKSRNSTLHTVNQTLLKNTLLKKAVQDHFSHFHQFRENKKQEQQQGQNYSDGSSSAPSQCNYHQQYLLESIFPNAPITKHEDRYRTKSWNKVGRRNMSLSIDDRSKLSVAAEDKSQKPKDVNSKKSLKDQRSQIYNKLPLINSQMKQEEEPVYQFHAFNFKSKKIANRNFNKKFSVLFETNIG